MGRLVLLVRKRCQERHPLLPQLGYRGLLVGGPKPECTGGPPRLLRRASLLPMRGERLRVYGHVDSAIPFWRLSGKRYVIEAICGYNLLLLLLRVVFLVL